MSNSFNSVGLPPRPATAPRHPASLPPAPVVTATINAAGVATWEGLGEFESFTAQDPRQGRAWVWGRLRQRLDHLPAGTKIVVIDAITGRHELLARPLLNPAPTRESQSGEADPVLAGNTAGVDETTAPAPATLSKVSRRGRTAPAPAKKRKLWLLGVGIAALAVLAFGLWFLYGWASSLTSSPTPDPSSSSAQPGQAAGMDQLWSIPFSGESGTAMTAGDQVVTVDKDVVTGHSLTDGTTTASWSAPSGSSVRLLAGEGLVLAITGEKGAVFDGTTATEFTATGKASMRGTTPFFVTGTGAEQKALIWDAKAKKFTTKDAPVKGASPVGIAAADAMVWALTGGRVTVVTGTEAAPPVTLAAPASEAKIAGWVAVTDTAVIVTWKGASGTVAAMHSLESGAILAQVPVTGVVAKSPTGQIMNAPQDGNPSLLLATEKTLTAESGTCAEALHAVGTWWCPTTDGHFSSAGADAPTLALPTGQMPVAGQGETLLSTGEGHLNAWQLAHTAAATEDHPTK